MRSRPRVLIGAATAGTLLLTGCASAASSTPSSDARVQVLASFYPLQYVVARVGGEHVDVSSLTPPGAEPHDVELSPRQVRTVGEADLLVYLSGFQSAVDEAVASREPASVVDAADVVELVVPADDTTHGTEDDPAHGDDAHGDEHDDEPHDDQHDDQPHDDDGVHSAEEHAADDGHDHGGLDPHFWLDPQRLARLAGPVADALAELDPGRAGDFAAAAERLEADLGELDAAYRSGLANCERRVVVTSHEAFGYLTRAYDLEQVGISGIDPEAEPSPARLREIGDVVRAEGVTTLYTETLVNPKVARTLADDLGVGTALLDPVESQADPAADYRAVMEQNLAVLRDGLGCT